MKKVRTEARVLELPSHQRSRPPCASLTILARILALKQTRILDVHLEPEGLVLDAAPTTRVPICSGCCKRVHAVHDTYERRGGGDSTWTWPG